MSKILAMIPARGGSKSIPLKNIKKLNGQPLILWSIQELIQAREVDEVWVSTDSDEIEEVVSSVRSSKIRVYRRNPDFAQDQSSTEDALIEFIRAVGCDKDNVLLVQATSPFTKSIHFDEAIKAYRRDDIDSLLSVVESKRFFWDLKGKPVNYDHQNRPRRQDFSPCYMENGAFYLNRASNILNNRNRLSGKIGYYLMPEYCGLEIDEPLDWLNAEFLMRELNYKAQFVFPKEVKLFASDVDGVLTDAGMYYAENGDEQKKFNTRDGKGFELLRNAGVKTALITSETTKIVERRAEKLKVDYLYQGKEHGGKLDAIVGICKKEGISLEEVAYIGDDINCLEALANVGFAACPSDAVPTIKKINGIQILGQSGGHGCVREFVEILLKK